jgi:hypothetical protein
VNNYIPHQGIFERTGLTPGNDVDTMNPYNTSVIENDLDHDSFSVSPSQFRFLVSPDGSLAKSSEKRVLSSKYESRTRLEYTNPTSPIQTSKNSNDVGNSIGLNVLADGCIVSSVKKGKPSEDIKSDYQRPLKSRKSQLSIATHSLDRTTITCDGNVENNTSPVHHIGDINDNGSADCEEKCSYDEFSTRLLSSSNNVCTLKSVMKTRNNTSQNRVESDEYRTSFPLKDQQRLRGGITMDDDTPRLTTALKKKRHETSPYEINQSIR